MPTLTSNGASASGSRRNVVRSIEEQEFWGRVRNKPVFKAKKQRTPSRIDAEAIARHGETEDESSSGSEGTALHDDTELQEDDTSLDESTPEQVSTSRPVHASDSDRNALLHYLKDIKNRQLAMQHEVAQLRTGLQDAVRTGLRVIVASQLDLMRKLQIDRQRSDQKLESLQETLLDRNNELMARLANMEARQVQFQEYMIGLAEEASETRIAVERLPTLDQKADQMARATRESVQGVANQQTSIAIIQQLLQLRQELDIIGTAVGQNPVGELIAKINAMQQKIDKL